MRQISKHTLRDSLDTVLIQPLLSFRSKNRPLVFKDGKSAFHFMELPGTIWGPQLNWENAQNCSHYGYNSATVQTGQQDKWAPEDYPNPLGWHSHTSLSAGSTAVGGGMGLFHGRAAIPMGPSRISDWRRERYNCFAKPLNPTNCLWSAHPQSAKIPPHPLVRHFRKKPFTESLCGILCLSSSPEFHLEKLC